MPSGTLKPTTTQAVNANFSALAPWLYDPQQPNSFVLDPSWLPGETVGDSAAPADHADDGQEALFTYLFNSFTEVQSAIVNASGAATTRAAQTNAAAAWAAHWALALPAWNLVGPASGTDGFVIRTYGGQIALDTPFTTGAGLTSRRTNSAILLFQGPANQIPGNALQGDFYNDPADTEGGCQINNDGTQVWAGFGSGLWSGKDCVFSNVGNGTGYGPFKFESADSIFILDFSADNYQNTQDVGTLVTSKAVRFSSVARQCAGYEFCPHYWSGQVTAGGLVTTDTAFSGMTIQAGWVDQNGTQHYQGGDAQWNWGEIPRQSDQSVVCHGNIAGRIWMTNLLSTFQHTNSGYGGVVADYSRAYRSTLAIGGN